MKSKLIIVIACASLVLLLLLKITGNDALIIQTPTTVQPSFENLPAVPSKSIQPQNLLLSPQVQLKTQTSDTLKQQNNWLIESPLPRESGQVGWKISNAKPLLQRIHNHSYIELTLPGLERTLQSTLRKKSPTTTGNHSYSGKIMGHSNLETLIVVQGELETYITAQLLNGNMSIAINNATGEGSLVDEAKTAANYLRH